MKSFAVASVLLAAVAVAQPHGHQHRRHQQMHEKRELVTEIEWVTETAYVTKLVDSTTTVWVSSGSEAESTSTTDQAKFIETPQPKKKKVTTTSTSTTTTSTPAYVAPEPTTTSTTSTSVYVAPVETSTSSTSVYVPPVEKKTSTSVYVAPTTSEVYVPPTTTEVYVAPTTAEEPAATTSASSGGGGSGSYTGDITYYDLGTNACGGSAAGEDYSSNIVALPKDMMGGDGPTYSTTENCGKSITIKANGKTITAIAKDKCMGCSGGAIDVSKKIFTYLFDSLDEGRGECEWWFN
ncbi:hypothetical protein B0T10DRAFT_311670 [Thelonectria olida]|uniref:Allergen Asp f 7 n=1 Tax=Thelonectria olida TaxID=1576542 RepID=A0A9P9AN85_9HYPO|nr:hypothetical protein B0T10DRAFT_311670 [Thelonectria olida]